MSFINSTDFKLGTHFICRNVWVGLLDAQLPALFCPHFCIAALKTSCLVSLNHAPPSGCSALYCAAVPDHRVCTDDKLGSRVPLVVGYVVVRLKPDPLLTFGQEAVVTRLPFSILHHWQENVTPAEMVRSTSKAPKKSSVEYLQCSWHFASVSRSSTW